MSFEELLAGNIPVTLEEKTMAAGMLLKISRRIVPVTSLLLASARRDHFERDTAGWVRWCREHFEMEGSDRDHRRAIGELLLDMRENTAAYNTLFFLAFDKLLSLTRLEDPHTKKVDPRQVAAFLSHYNVKEMKREEVRDAVALWLNEKPRERSIESDLPGFTAAVEAITQMKESALCIRISDEESAGSALKAGFMLLGATLHYHTNAERKNVELLQGFRLELLQGIEQLETHLAECCIQQDDECCIQQDDECCIQQDDECCIQQDDVCCIQQDDVCCVQQSANF